MSMRSWDTETRITTYMKRKASPFMPDNWVVTHAFKDRATPGVVEFRFGKTKPPAGWLKPVLHGVRLLVGMNIKFDLLHALQDAENLEAWMDWVAGGGQVWDIQLAEYLLCGMEQQSHMLSLDEIGARYANHDYKLDEIKPLWDAGVQTDDIEPALLTRYLCGGVNGQGEYKKGDVENTENIAIQQIGRARDAGQVNSIMLNMGALLFTVEAERNGMAVDKERGLQIAAELEVRVTELAHGLAQFIPKDCPFDFNWSSRFHKSALIFGGVVNWDAHEYDVVGGPAIYRHVYEAIPTDQRPKLVYAQKDETHYLLADGSGTIECDEWAKLPFEVKPPIVVNAGGKNKGEPKTKKVKVDNLDKPKGRGVKAPYRFAGFTKPEKRWETSEPGVYQTSSAVIEELGTRDIPFLKLFAELQSLTKDLGTYYIRTDEEGVQTGMLSLIGLDGLIHHKLNMTSTVTARLSSSDPNLQNIPKGNKSEVKTLFISRFGGVIIQSDFSSLEVYVQAILTRCKQLIADLKAGLDLHVVRLAAKEGMDYAEVFKLAKGYIDEQGNKVPAVKEWDYKRTGAKVYSFQRAFGAGYKKIADSTGMDIEDVEKLAVAEDARYPEIEVYYKGVTEDIKASRRPWRTVPHNEVRGVMCNLGRGYYRTPDKKLYSYFESPAPEFLVKRGTTQSFSPTEIKNYVVQGTGGEWAKAAMWLAVREFYRARNFGGRALLVNQVHDACYVDAAHEVKLDAAALLHACMEGASDLMQYLFDWDFSIPVPSDTTWGASMMDEDSIPGLKEAAAPLRADLRTRYMGGMVPTYLQGALQ